MAVYPLLALLWALVLVPPMVRRRAHNRAEFPEFDRMRLSRVGRSTPVSPPRDEITSAPVRRSATQRRRRVLALIGTTLVVTLVVALVMRTRLAWGMHLLAYDVLIAYVGLLARASDRQTVRRPVLVPVPRPIPAGPLDYVPRRFPRASHRPTPAPSALPTLLQAASR